MATTTEITTLPDGEAPVTQQVIELEGRTLVLVFRYSRRCAMWRLDVDEYPDTPLDRAIGVRPGVDLFAGIVGLGVLHVISTDGSLAAPTRESFANSEFRMWYEPLGTWGGQP